MGLSLSKILDTAAKSMIPVFGPINTIKELLKNVQPKTQQAQPPTDSFAKKAKEDPMTLPPGGEVYGPGLPPVGQTAPTAEVGAQPKNPTAAV